jgi:hypothetical protein
MEGEAQEALTIRMRRGSVGVPSGFRRATAGRTVPGWEIAMKVVGIVESDRFEHRIVQPHFINPCCFGEDLATWLREQLRGLSARGFEIDPPLQEDYGWGFWLRNGKSKFWLALSYVGEGPTEDPAQWGVSITHSGLMASLFGRADQDAIRAIEDGIRAAVAASGDIRWVEGAG